ncbi:MAG TPA: thymidine phosphorylase, partial [Aggregatilineales bacterium]|nr:thymidine phosphorylase [Aggregatilineales bacterium]
KLYALRDVTATVGSLPLIASSIMSKKIAAGADVVVLDVKIGLGAFMTHIEEAKQLARLMVEIGTRVGQRVVALLSDMNQPLGCAVGNALEVVEAIDCLHGGGPRDLREHCLVVAAHMLRLAHDNRSEFAMADYMSEAASHLDDGTAFQKFRLLVEAQGGDVSQIEQPDTLPKARLVHTLKAPRGGYIQQLNALQVGIASVDLGAGRERKTDPIDPAVGVIVHKKVGDSIVEGEPTFTLHADDEKRLETAIARLTHTIVYSDTVTTPLPAFYDTIGA